MLVRHRSILGLAAVFACTFAQAQDRAPTHPGGVHLGGMINDYSPATINGTVVGPYEIRGTWSMRVNDRSGLANFSASLNMEKSDYAIVEGLVDVEDPSTRSPHTHGITMTDAALSYDTSTCPANSPANTLLFMISGPVAITANGGSVLSGSSLNVCVSGGTGTPYSTVTLVFTGPATDHFGSQPIHGYIGAAK